MSVVLTCGTFDLPHFAHYRLLTLARGYGDTLVVGVHDGSHDKQPIMTLAERIATLAAAGIADHVVGYGDPFEIVERIRPDRIVQGDDWFTTGPDRRRIAELVDVVLVPRTPGICTADLRARLLEDR